MVPGSLGLEDPECPTGPAEEGPTVLGGLEATGSLGGPFAPGEEPACLEDRRFSLTVSAFREKTNVFLRGEHKAAEIDDFVNEGAQCVLNLRHLIF